MGMDVLSEDEATHNGCRFTEVVKAKRLQSSRLGHAVVGRLPFSAYDSIQRGREGQAEYHRRHEGSWVWSVGLEFASQLRRPINPSPYVRNIRTVPA